MEIGNLNFKIWLNSKYNNHEQHNLTHLDCSNLNFNNLKGIENLTNLKWLNCSNNNLYNLMYIKRLKNLQYLNCSNNKLKNLNGIKKMNLIDYFLEFNNFDYNYYNTYNNKLELK